MPAKHTKQTPGTVSFGPEAQSGAKRGAARSTTSSRAGHSHAGGGHGRTAAAQPSRPSASSMTGGLNAKTLVTRRTVLIGAAAVGGIAAVGGGISLASSALDSTTETIDCISVPEKSVVALSDYEEIDAQDCVTTAATYTLNFGTLVWADNDTVAACLIPGEEASPLNTVGLLYLSSGTTTTVLEEAQGTEEGFEIFDVRASEEGVVWTELNVYESQWRVYTATLSNAALANIELVDEGNANWLAPSLAAVGKSAFWQVSPNTSGDEADAASEVRVAKFGATKVKTICTSKSAFATRITAATDGVVVTPRASSTSTYYQLTKISASSYEIEDQMTLPASMVPDIAAHGTNGFAFGFTSIYDYGDGIANLGTYVPSESVKTYHYNNKQWFRFSRSPITAPCWCGEWFVVKSTSVLCGVRFSDQSYFSIDMVSGADDYGEHLVSSGTCSSFVGLSQVTPDDGSDSYAYVRVFSPVTT